MPLYLIRRWEGEPEARWHSGLKWLRPLDMRARAEEFPMPPADLPLVAYLIDFI